MATFRGASDFARELDRLNASMAKATRDATLEMAKKAERILNREAKRDLGGDTQFSGWSPRDLGDLVIKKSRQRDGHWIYPTRKSGGPWKVAELGRNATGAQGGFQGPLVSAKTGGTLNMRFNKRGTLIVRRRGVKRWNGVTAGKGTASRATTQFDAVAERIADRMMRTTVKRHFD